MVSTFEQGLNRWRGFGFFSPSFELARQDLALLRIKCIFSIVSEAKLKRRRSYGTETHSGIRCWPNVRYVVGEGCSSEQCIKASDEFTLDAGQTLFEHLVHSDISRATS